MNDAVSTLLGPFNGPQRGDPRRPGESQARWRTCLVPARARTVLAQATAVAYDAGFWYGTAVPEVPAYAQAVATAAYERGRFDAITTGGADSHVSDPAPEPPAAD